MNRSNQNYTRPEYLRTGSDYGGYLARPSAWNSTTSLFRPPAEGPLDSEEDLDPLRLDIEPLRPHRISSFPARPHLQNQTQNINIDTTRNTIPWQPAADAFPNFQRQPSVQASQGGSKLSQEEQKTVLNRLKKEVYSPMSKLLKRKPNLYYRDDPLTISRELQKEKDEEGKKCAICLEDFEPKEMVTVTPCKHMFHEECIVPWVKSEGRCPVCRFAISDRLRETAAGSSNVTANEGFQSDLIAIIRAMEEALVSENMRRFL